MTNLINNDGTKTIPLINHYIVFDDRDYQPIAVLPLKSLLLLLLAFAYASSFKVVPPKL